MGIIKFDFSKEEEKIDEIKQRYREMKVSIDSIKEYSHKYRELATDIEIEYNYLRRSFDVFTPFLLIQCHTFMEQLLKRFTLIMLSNGERNQQFIRNYGTSITPRVDMPELKKMICAHTGLNGESVFIYESVNEKKFKEGTKLLNELVKERHEYAHVGTYIPKEIDEYGKILDFVEYILTEMKYIVKHKDNPGFYGKRNETLSNYIEMKPKIVNDLKKYHHNPEENSKEEMKQKIKNYESIVKDVTVAFQQIGIKNDIFEQINTENLKWTNIDVNCRDTIKILIDQK